MANNQSQQWGKKIQQSRLGMAKAKKVPKNQSEDQTSGSLPPTPFVSTKEQIEDPLFLDIDLWFPVLFTLTQATQDV